MENLGAMVLLARGTFIIAKEREAKNRQQDFGVVFVSYRISRCFFQSRAAW